MGLPRTCATLLAVAAWTAQAGAQPVDPYKQAAPRPAPAATPPAPAPPEPAVGPQDPYAVPPGQDPILTEQIAEQLVGRAQELFDAKIYLEAKQLAVETLVENSRGAAAEHAKFIIKQVNQQLGIRDDQPVDPNEVPPSTIDDPTKRVVPIEPPQPAEGEARHDGRTAAAIHSAIYGGLIGATLGSFFDTSNPAGGAVPVGIGVGLLSGLYLPRAFRSWDEAQVRTVGAGTVWGGAIGGLFAAVVTGSNGGTETAPGILVGASLGASAGGVGGYLLARDHKLTRGDVALVDTFAGIGTVGGLTMGMLMQPAQGEAYSLNAALGAAGGVVVGLIAAPQTNTTPRRMLRVAGLAAAGGALPFLLYAAIQDPSTTSDEQLTGALSSIGLIGGAWLGFYLTRHMDEGLDVQDGKKPPPQDAPPAIVGRNSDGRWSLGPLAVTPLSPQLAPQHGVALTLLGGAF